MCVCVCKKKYLYNSLLIVLAKEQADHWMAVTSKNVDAVWSIKQSSAVVECKVSKMKVICTRHCE